MVLEDDIYQDIRIYGQTVFNGRRNCETRYQVLQNFMERYKNKKIKILDFGSNYGYFTWRLHEDYPKMELTAVDRRPMLRLLYELNNHENITIISNDMNLEMIKEHAQNHHYDIILLMSVVHHFENPEMVLDTFQQMGDVLIVEADYPDVPNFKGNQKYVYDHLITKNPIQLNTWIEHDRPIYYIANNETYLKGKVSSGSGLAQETFKFLNEIFDWIGVQEYPGTLNIELEKGITWDSFFNIGNHSFIQMFLNGLPVLAIKDVTLNPPNTFLELVSTHNLRERLKLKDGDEVVISFNSDNIQVIE
jgi:hypothetical protein